MTGQTLELFELPDDGQWLDWRKTWDIFFSGHLRLEGGWGRVGREVIFEENNLPTLFSVQIWQNLSNYLYIMIFWKFLRNKLTSGILLDFLQIRLWWDFRKNCKTLTPAHTPKICEMLRDFRAWWLFTSPRTSCLQSGSLLETFRFSKCWKT